VVLATNFYNNKVFTKRIYIKQKPYKPSGKNKFVRYTFLVFIFLFTVNVFANIFFYPDIAKGSLFVSPLATSIIRKTISIINLYENSKNLENIVKSELGNDSNNFAVVIKNLNTGERYYLNERKIFNTASLYKLWVMAVVFQKLNDGSLEGNDVLSSGIAQLNSNFNISSDSAELTDGSITLSVKKALEKMIIFSDNYSAYLLTQKVNLTNVSQFLNDNDFSDSKVGTGTDNPKASARDMAAFLDKLYHDKLEDRASSDEMLSLLKRQQLNGKLPKYIPQNIVIAHKTGELGLVSHDAGIIYSPKGDYIIVVLSQTPNPLGANEKIANLSKKVYDYFIK
jgi:beta-lactamase class A